MAKKDDKNKENLPVPSGGPISRITRAVSGIQYFGIKAFEGIKDLFRFAKI